MTPSALRLVFWETTTGCNLACRHCRRLEVSRTLAREDLTTDEATRLIDGIASVGQPVLVFSGGEPLMRPDLFELASYARCRDLPIALATNGTLIDAAMAARIVESGFDRVAISLDGADARTHDAFRNQSGAFDRALDGFQRLQRRGVSLQINTTITQHDVGQLDAMYELVVALGAQAWHLFMFVPVGCGLEIPGDQQLAAQQYEDVLHWMARKARLTHPFIRATCAPQYFRILAQQHQLAGYRAASHLSTMTKGCLAGTGICFVSHKGEVFPCGYLPVSCGNVKLEPFPAIWASSVVLAALRDPDCLKGKCGACEFRRLCSGCRARAYAATGDYLTEEPCCTYAPQAGPGDLLCRLTG
ncbi:MAG: radical SAM protein [Candidatus Omnitrophica bacterium]|nr:radical SAM protein [Candidatus Omnitrophota bacterium]